MRELLKTVKGKIILGAVATGVLATIVVIAVMNIKSESTEAYRTISVEEVNGTCVVLDSENTSCNAYKGMHLYSGNDVSVQEKSDMTMLLDMNKYVYAEENTHFWLEAEGSSEKSKTRIYLDQGSVLNRIDTKLTKGETYQVNTPNSVMAVRGTVFRVSVEADEEGKTLTNLDVYQGTVAVDLKDAEGKLNGNSEVFEAGEAAVIRADEENTEFVADENGNIKREIDFKSLPQETAEQLVDYIDDGEELSIEKELLMDYTALTEHQMEEVVVEEATCSKEGKKEIRCIVCNEVEETISIPCLSHKKSTTWETVKKADCTGKGQEQLTCSLCGEVLETRETQMTEHKEGRFVVVKKASCKEEGKAEIHCIVCDKVLRTEVLSILPHQADEGKIIKESTCTEAGQIVKSCTVCNAIIEKTAIEPLGHNFGEWKETKAASCERTGTKTRTCARCQKTETVTISALEHKYGEWKETKAASCESAGTKTRTCAHCQKTETMSVAATGHNFGEWSDIQAPGCESEGVRSRSCSHCGKTETMSVAATGHNFGEWSETQAPGCESEGVRSRTCSRCGKTETMSIAALGHSYSNGDWWKETKAPGCESGGECSRTCSRCQYTETRPIPATGHNYQITYHKFDDITTVGSPTSIPTDRLCTSCGAVDRTSHTVTLLENGSWQCQECGGQVTQ